MEAKLTHLKYITELPSDVIEVKHYGKYDFDNVYYSPSTQKLYQKYDKRIREISPSPKRNSLLIRSSSKKTVYVSMKKLLKELNNNETNKNEATQTQTEQK